MVGLVLRPRLNEMTFEQELDKTRGFYPMRGPSNLTKTGLLLRLKQSSVPWGSWGGPQANPYKVRKASGQRQAMCSCSVPTPAPPPFLHQGQYELGRLLRCLYSTGQVRVLPPGSVAERGGCLPKVAQVSCPCVLWASCFKPWACSICISTPP